MRLLGVLALACAVLGAGCPAGTSKIGSQPSWRQASGARAEFAAEARPGEPFPFPPRSEPALTYNDTAPAAVPVSAMTEAVVDAVRAASVSAGIPAPVSEGRLFAAAADLAAVVHEEGVVAYGLVEFAMQHHGIIEPSPHLLVAWGLLDDPMSIVEQLAPRIPELLTPGGNARVGVGAARRTARGEGVVILAVQTSNVTTRPIPRSLGTTGRTSIEGKVTGGYRDPEVFVTREDGLVAQLPSQVRGGAAGEFRAEVSCEGRNGRQ